ncbi:MAG: glycoside hydrolase family 88 protein, partial [bacterium]
MRQFFSICFMLVMVSITNAQHNDIDETVTRRIADYILEHSEFTFQGMTNRQTYNTTKDIPENVEVRFKSPFGEWHYTNGVLNMAMINLGLFLNEEKYTDFAIRHVAFGFENYKFFQKRFPGDRPHHRYPFGQLWTMEELDDCGAMGASVIEVYQKVKHPEYKDYIEKTARHITEKQDRITDGTLVRSFPNEMTLWADDLYMSVPFLARMGKFSGNQKYYDDAIHQVLKFTQYL